MRKTDMGQALKKLVTRVFAYHKGFGGERTPEGILFKDKLYATDELFRKAVDTFIREGGVIISNSLNRKK